MTMSCLVILLGVFPHTRRPVFIYVQVFACVITRVFISVFTSVCVLYISSSGRHPWSDTNRNPMTR